MLLHADERILVFEKPSGLLSVPGIGPANADCLALRAATSHPGARIVHRLDQATSGLIVLALDADALRRLSLQFERREVEKAYVAVVDGVVDDDTGTIDLPMRKDMERKSRHLIDHAQGKHAVTRWRVLERDAASRRTRLELRPETGRSHQLRLHLSSIGHPIVGDDVYAPPEVAAASPRLLLRATRLAFAHPEHGGRVAFESAPTF